MMSSRGLALVQPVRRQVVFMGLVAFQTAQQAACRVK
jgi:hypothetical protein